MVHFLFHMTHRCGEGFEIHPATRCSKTQQGLRIDPRRLVSKLLHVLNVRAGINRRSALRAALAAEFQHA